MFAVALGSFISPFIMLDAFTLLSRHVFNWIQSIVEVPFLIRLQFSRLIVSPGLVGIFSGRDFLGSSFGLDVRLPQQCSRIKTPERKISTYGNNENGPKETHRTIFGSRSWHTDYQRARGRSEVRASWPRARYFPSAFTMVFYGLRARGHTGHMVIINYSPRWRW